MKRMRFLRWFGLCAESTLKNPHKGFAEATLKAGDKTFKFMLCKDHAIEAARMLKDDFGAETVVVP